MHGYAQECQVNALGGAASENHLIRVGVDQIGDSSTAFVDLGGHAAAWFMGDTARIRVVLGHPREHRIEHTPVEPRRRVVIEIDLSGQFG